MCPFTVCGGTVKCLVTHSAMSPGHPLRYPFLMAWEEGQFDGAETGGM